MRSTYRVLAYIIAAEVVVQASAIAFGLFGLSKWVQDGGTLDKAAMEDESLSFTGLPGFIIHGINGQMVIPLLVLVLLIISFFAKVPGGSKWAGTILALVVIQVMLGIFGHETPQLGPVHGANALLLFSVAIMAGRRTRSFESADVSTRSRVRV